jgi:ribosomal protein L7/L12
LLKQGEKIKAIKLFRDRTGAGLKEAKDAVEAIERGEPTRRTPAEIETELAPLLKQGEKIKAIKLFRDRTGAGLKEAKDAVEALEPRYPRQMHCPNCGARAEPADAACHACGARLARPGVGCAWWWVAIVAAAAGLAASLYAASFFK